MSLRNVIWQNTVASDCRLIEDQFNRILGHHGFDEVFQYVLEDIENKEVRASIEDKRLRNNILTINEVRAGYDETPVEWGDKPFTSISGAGNNPLIPNGVTPEQDIVKQNKLLRKSLLNQRLKDEYT